MFSLMAFIFYIITIIVLIINIFKRLKIHLHLYTLSLIFVFLISEIVFRSIQIKFIALTNTFESLIFFSAFIILIILIYLSIKISKKEDYSISLVFIIFIISFTLFAIASSPIAPKEIKPPIPALQSGWLILHVSLSFVGESFFAFGFASSIYYMFLKDQEKKIKVENLIYKSIVIGYPIFSAGALIFGAVWAFYAWGRFWGWDPKETFALITWLVYTIYLHLRLLTKTERKKTVIVSIIGFLLTLFTFFGVNFLLPGLHSYK